MKQTILPAISDYKTLEIFLKSDLEYCVVLNFSLVQLNQVSRLIHEYHKKMFVHMDLIKGVGSNEDGAIFVIEAFQAAGLISTHPGVIIAAKKKKVLAIQRIFIIDSQSLKRSIEISKKCRPDYIELLPGYAYEVKEKIEKELDIPLIGGGLISDKQMVDRCLKSGLKAVTTSEISLWSNQDKTGLSIDKQQ